jgi:hypothetical protein
MAYLRFSYTLLTEIFKIYETDLGKARKDCKCEINFLYICASFIMAKESVFVKQLNQRRLIKYT